MLVGIPNAPSVYSLDINPDLAHQRQEKVVECMVELEYITENDGKTIINNKGKFWIDTNWKCQ